MIRIDGSKGEGGGQVLRTSLALSIVTGEPFEVRNIRAKRKRPGLMKQHLTSVKAAVAISNAEVIGDKVGSRRLTFKPQGATGGNYRFSVGTAGSASLVLQTILPPLALAKEPSEVVIEGGTHNPSAPPFDFLQKVFLPLLAEAGLKVELTLERAGYFPTGGGRIKAIISPIEQFAPIERVDRGQFENISVRAVVANLPVHIAQREAVVLKEELGMEGLQTDIIEDLTAVGAGNTVVCECKFAGACELFTGFGQKGVPAEIVAAKMALEAKKYLYADVPVGPYLADQLLIPMALAKGGIIKTLAPTKHTKTNLSIIQKFLPVQFDVSKKSEDVYTIAAKES